MARRWKHLGLFTRVALLAAVGVLVLSAAAYGYFAFRTTGAAAPAGLGEAPGSRGGPSDLDGDAGACRRRGLRRLPRAREARLRAGSNDAVGRTTAVRGAMTIADGRIETTQVTADLPPVARSDEPGHAPAAPRRPSERASSTERFA